MRYEAVKGGLRIEKRGSGYDVRHEDSGLAVVQRLRQRRFAEQARDELLATGVDFTMHQRVIQLSASHWKDVYDRWRGRTQAQGDKLADLDPVTFEYYPCGSRYGQLVPSEAQAAEMRELADRLRKHGPVPADWLESSAPYLHAFNGLGWAYDDGDGWIWRGPEVTA